jgi:hypothetical protein
LVVETIASKTFKGGQTGEKRYQCVPLGRQTYLGGIVNAPQEIMNRYDFVLQKEVAKEVSAKATRRDRR